MWIIREGDCLNELGSLPDSFVDAVVTDPPYGLEFMGKKWDKFEPYAYAQWCHEWAAECMRVLKPGGHLLACGSTRTSHRLTCGIEDAGFEIRDSLIWIHGQGFPKNLNVGKAIDKAAGAEREVIPGKRQAVGVFAHSGSGTPQDIDAYADSWHRTAPATAEAKEWDGWGTALKPSHEPIVMARKPFKGPVAANVLFFGTGAINVDGCRVGSEERVNGPGHNVDGSGWGMRPRSAPSAVAGRWPANVALDEDAAAELDRQSGTSTSRLQPRTERRGGKATNFAMRTSGQTHADSGGASRFFYCAKAGKAERPQIEGVEGHPTVKPLALIRWLIRMVCQPGGLILDPFAGTGTLAEAAELEGFDSLLIENDPVSILRIGKRMSKYGELVA